MKKIFYLLLIALVLTACLKKETEELIEEVIEEEILEEVLEEKKGKPSPLSGIYVEDESLLDKRVVAIMFDNHPKARWQAALKDAEIVFEIPVEPPYTRYMGLYLINSPDNIGPVRSARPYFIKKAMEFDAIYVHVGGSDAAKSDIKNYSIANIDGLTSEAKVFYRKSHKKMPNNLYTNMEVLRETALNRKYRDSGAYESFKFSEEDVKIGDGPGESIFIPYYNNNTSEYKYIAEEGKYTRKKDGKDHIDESDESLLMVKNIIIQYSKVKVIDNEGRLSVDLIGEGLGKYISLGSSTDIIWKKASEHESTKYYDKNMNEIVLNPGQTWIQIVPLDIEVEIH